MAKKFNPLSIERDALYDKERAKELGFKKDKGGHSPSRDPITGRILKGQNHPTFSKALWRDIQMGYRPHIDQAGNVFTNLPPGVRPVGARRVDAVQELINLYKRSK